MKKLILGLFVSLCLILSLSVSASELEKSFETSFDLPDFCGDIYSMTSYDDSGNVDGYILYNSALLIKYDLNDKLIWEKTDLTVNDLKVVSDNDDLIIKKIDSETNSIVWQNRFGGNGEERINNIFYDYDSKNNITGYLLMIHTSSTDLDIVPGDYTMKYDFNGKLLWIKPCSMIYGREYLKNKDGDFIEFSTYHGNHGIVELKIFNITTNKQILYESYSMSCESGLISNGEYVTFILYDTRDNKNISTKLFRYDSEGTVILEKQLELSIDPAKLINSKTIDGDIDGFISVNYYDLTNAIIKFDYDGNLIWKKELSYKSSFIAESYDETGEFNGYIVTGYDRVNKKGYITKFTYPKKVIESKNSDVEVINDAYPGKTVTVKAKEKTGYVVKRIIVKDSSGKEIEVGSDGTFIMPDDDVSIEVIYEKKVENIIINPDTASTLSIVLIIISIVIIGSVMVRNRKYLER